MEFLAGSLLELITQTSTKPSPRRTRGDGRLRPAAKTPGTQSSQALDIIFVQRGHGHRWTRVRFARIPGMPTFVIHTPVGVNQIRFKKAILDAIAEATRLGKLRPQFRGLSHGEEQRQQPRRRDAGCALRAMGNRTRLRSN